MLISIDRGDCWQLAYVIPHQGFGNVKTQGLPGLRAAVASAAPALADRVGAITDWEQVKLLSVRVDRLRTGDRLGLLCIGDAAHAMSPAGVSGSTSPSRTPRRRPTCSGRPSTQAGRQRTISGESSGAESLPPASPRGSR